MTDPDFMAINYETLQQAQTDLGVAFVSAKQTIDELQAKLHDHLKDWSGDAQVAYDEVQKDWTKAFGDMARVLDNAQVHVGNAHEMYQQVERQNLSIWHR